MLFDLYKFEDCFDINILTQHIRKPRVTHLNTAHRTRRRDTTGLKYVR